MVLPTRTVVGQYTSNGKEAVGYLEFTPSHTRADGVSIYPVETKSAYLDSTGSFSIDLDCNDTVGLGPDGWVWIVEEKIKNGKVWYLDLPYSVDSLDIVNAYALGTVLPVLTVQGPAGPVGPVGPVGPSPDVFNGIYNVEEYGAVGDGITDDTLAIQAAIDAASAADGTVLLPPKIFKITGDGLLAKSANIVGTSSRSSSNTAGKGSVLLGSNQTGPVLSIVGSANVAGFMGTRVFKDFGIIGDGVNSEHGIYLYNTHCMSFNNIYVKNTVGIPWYAEACYFVSVVQCQIQEPVNVYANDTPYIKLAHVNSWTTVDWLLRAYSSATVATVGPSGAIIIKDNTAYESTLNNFHFVLEYLLVQEGSVGIIDHRGNGNIISLTCWDSGNKGTVTTPWAYITLNTNNVNNYGGNIVVGRLMGTETSTTAYGVKILQSFNAVDAVAGYSSKSVYMGAGVSRCSVILRGYFNTPTGAHVIDDSGNTQNWVQDIMTGFKVGGTAKARFNTATDVVAANLDGVLGLSNLASSGYPSLTVWQFDKIEARPAGEWSAGIGAQLSKFKRAIDTEALIQLEYYTTAPKIKLGPGGSTVADVSIERSGTAGLRFIASGMGFYDKAAIAKPTVTGSKTSGEALTSLLAQLVALGLINDSTSA